MPRFIIAIIVSALALFVWGFVSWTVLDWHTATTGRIAAPAQLAATTALKVANVPAGTYFIPPPPDGNGEETDEEKKAAVEEWEAKHTEGPIGFLVYHPEGRPPMATSMFLYGIAINVIACTIAACLLAAASIGNFFGRFLFVVALGAFVGVTADGSFWNYMYFHDDWTKVMIADRVASWAIAGVILAGLTGPRSRQRASAAGSTASA